MRAKHNPDILPASANICIYCLLFTCFVLGAFSTHGFAAEEEKKMSLVSYFEIPVTNMKRATAFYQSVFDVELAIDTIDGIEMALFPDNEGGTITGALAKGESYVPGKQGARIYFAVTDIDSVLRKVMAQGGTDHYPKTSIGELGYVAEFIDSEGNIIALHQSK